MNNMMKFCLASLMALGLMACSTEPEQGDFTAEELRDLTPIMYFIGNPIPERCLSDENVTYRDGSSPLFRMECDYNFYELDDLYTAIEGMGWLHDEEAGARGDLLGGEAAESAELVTANPPYVTTAEWRGLARRVREYEPRLALDGGGEGLDAISRLVREAGNVLRDGGRLVMEIGDSQGDAVEGLICQTKEMRMVRRCRDYGGRERLVVAERRRG